MTTDICLFIASLVPGATGGLSPTASPTASGGRGLHRPVRSPSPPPFPPPLSCLLISAYTCIHPFGLQSCELHLVHVISLLTEFGSVSDIRRLDIS